MNIPNQITMARLILAIILFILLSQVEALKPDQQVLILDISLVLFFFAAVSDYLDGYLARKYNLVTVFGRIADPFVDKILVIGIFIFLIPLSIFVRPWMVVIIIGREFLISGLRGYAESQGFPFPANMWGKTKTTWQCLTVGIILIYLAHMKDVQWMDWVVQGCLWLTVAITLFSGIIYVTQSKKLWSQAG